MQLNRAQRRAAKKQRRPVRGAGHIQLPINIRFGKADETQLQRGRPEVPRPRHRRDLDRPGQAAELDPRQGPRAVPDHHRLTTEA